MLQIRFEFCVQILTDINKTVYFLNICDLHQISVYSKEAELKFPISEDKHHFFPMFVVLISWWNNKVYNHFPQM